MHSDPLRLVFDTAAVRYRTIKASTALPTAPSAVEANQVRLHAFRIDEVTADFARHHVTCVEGWLAGKRRGFQLIAASAFAMILFAFATTPTAVIFMRHFLDKLQQIPEARLKFEGSARSFAIDAALSLSGLSGCSLRTGKNLSSFVSRQDEVAETGISRTCHEWAPWQIAG